MPWIGELLINDSNLPDLRFRFFFFFVTYLVTLSRVPSNVVQRF